MAMLEYALTVDVWYQLEDLDDAESVFLYLEGTDPVVCAFGAMEPDATSETGILLSEGVNAIPIPSGKSAWLKLLSGTGTVTFSQYGGINADRTKCAYALQNVTTSAEDVIAGNTDLIVGDDNSGDDPINHVGFLQTLAAGIAGAATVDSAVLSVSLLRFRAGQVLRFYGVAEATSQFSTILTYADIQDPAEITLTTEFVDITIGYTGIETVDITDLLQELVSVSGWDTTSPIQFQVTETTGFTSANDFTVSIFTGGKLTAVFANVS